METLRRLFLIVCTLAAVLTLMAPAPVLYHVKYPDFARELEHHPFPWDHKGQTPAQYMAEETKGLVVPVSPGKWQQIVQAFQAQPDGYLKAGDPAIQGLGAQMISRPPVRYLKKEGGPAGQFLRIRKLSPDSYQFSKAPFLYRHPYAPWSPLLLLAGFLLYIFLPRRRFADDALCYGTGFPAVTGPDLVALMIVTGFFSLGLLVGLSTAPGGFSSILSSDLILPTLILWAFSLFGVYMFKIAATYAGLGLQCKDNGQLIRFSPSNTETINIKDISSIRLGRRQSSKWVTRLGFLVSLLNWRALGPTLLNANRNDPQIEIQLKDGRLWVFSLTGALNVTVFLSCLEKNGLKLDPALKKFK